MQNSTVTFKKRHFPLHATQKTTTFGIHTTRSNQLKCSVLVRANPDQVRSTMAEVQSFTSDRSIKWLTLHPEGSITNNHLR